jgi:hypothetical protein
LEIGASVGFIVKKLVMMHGHMNVKKLCMYVCLLKRFIYRLCCCVAFKCQFVREPLMKATYQAGRVQASAWRARDKFPIYFYIGHFLLYWPFVMYRLPQTGSVPAQLHKEPSFLTPKRENSSIFLNVIFEEAAKLWALANTVINLP